MAVDALWDAIFSVCRITGDGKAVERWRQVADTIARQRGEVKISSVGMLGRYSTPSVVWAVAPAHTWPSGRRTFRSVPREFT